MQSENKPHIINKLVSLEIEMRELKEEIERLKMHLMRQRELIVDFQEIKEKRGKSKEMILIKSYW